MTDAQLAMLNRLTIKPAFVNGPEVRVVRALAAKGLATLRDNGAPESGGRDSVRYFAEITSEGKAALAAFEAKAFYGA